MIEKNRLEELMKNNGKIYHIIEFNGECAVEKNKAVDFNAVDLLYSLMNGDKNKWFETKEEAEWDLEFGNITRTETLSLPNYKIAKTYIDTDKFILEDNSNFKFLLLSNPDNIIIVDKQQGNQTFNKPLTKDNYIEACRLAKKLFLSEEE